MNDPVQSCSAVTTEPPTQEFVLRAMAANYAVGNGWDHLDQETCIKAADEIKALRSGDAYRAAWLDLIDLCNRIKEENFQLRHPPRTGDLAQRPIGSDKEATFGEDGYNPAYDDGITFAIVQLAEMTGSKDWQMRDGSEDHDTDVRDTIMDVLKCAGLYDDETGKFAALSPAPSSWRDIETAPKDGTSFLACTGNWMTVCHWHRHQHCWSSVGPSYSRYDADEQPTHWMPLPDGPSVPSTHCGGGK